MYAKADHDRIHEAILDAERRTSGEIFCVVTEESGHYHEVAFAWAAAIALLAPPAALIAGLSPASLVAGVYALEGDGWVAGHAGPLDGALMAALIGYALVQFVLFAGALGLFWIPAIRRRVTPARLKTAHVHARAMEQFAHRLHGGGGRAGVLIFASLAERRVQIIGDEDIHAKVGDAVWEAAIAAALSHIKAGDTAGGLIAAVKLCGDALAEHFPPGAAGPGVGEVAEI